MNPKARWIRLIVHTAVVMSHNAMMRGSGEGHACAQAVVRVSHERGSAKVAQLPRDTRP